MLLEVSTWIFWVVVTDGPMNPMKMVHFYSSGTCMTEDIQLEISKLNREKSREDLILKVHVYV